MHPVEKKIFKLLFNRRELLSGYQIAQKCDISISSTYYFLNKMVNANIIIKFGREDTKDRYLYGLNPIFFKAELWDKIIEHLTKIVEILQIEDEFGSPDYEQALKLVFSLITE